MATYPQYYRQGCTCIKRESDTRGNRVQIPEPCRIEAVGHTYLSTRDKASFDKLVTNMEEVNENVYIKYVSIFHIIKREHTEVFNTVGSSDFHDFTIKPLARV